MSGDGITGFPKNGIAYPLNKALCSKAYEKNPVPFSGEALYGGAAVRRGCSGFAHEFAGKRDGHLFDDGRKRHDFHKLHHAFFHFHGFGVEDDRGQGVDHDFVFGAALYVEFGLQFDFLAVDVEFEGLFEFQGFADREFVDRIGVFTNFTFCSSGVAAQPPNQRSLNVLMISSNGSSSVSPP